MDHELMDEVSVRQIASLGQTKDLSSREMP